MKEHRRWILKPKHYNSNKLILTTLCTNVFVSRSTSKSKEADQIFVINQGKSFICFFSFLFFHFICFTVNANNDKYNGLVQIENGILFQRMVVNNAFNEYIVKKEIRRK